MFICYNMKNYFFIIAYIVLTFQALGQEPTTIQGRLISEDSLGIDRVNILNLSKTKGTTTNIQGEFEIVINIGDTLLFSAIQFKNREWVVTDSIVKSGFILCVLELDDITLQDIVLTDFSMFDTNQSGGEIDMSLPFNTIPVVKSYTTRRALYLQGGIISSIVNRLNGNIKRNKAIMAYEKQRNLVEKTRGIFEDVFYENLGIPKNEIYLFIDFYMPEAQTKRLLIPDFKYELIQHIQNCVPKYLEYRDRKIDSIPFTE